MPTKMTPPKGRVMKFRLRAGTHVDRRGGKDKQRRLFKKGDIVESDKDLQKIWGRGKFVRVPDEVISSSGDELEEPMVEVVDEQKKLTLEEELRLEDEEEAANKKLKKEAKTPTDNEDEDETGGDGSDLELNDEKRASRHGEDVTNLFETAVSEEFVVYKNKKGKHFIADKDEPDVIVHKKGLEAEDVDEFIKKYVSEG